MKTPKPRYTLADLSRADATIAAILGFCAERNGLELRTSIERAVADEVRRLCALSNHSRLRARDAAEAYYARDIAEHLATNVRPTPEAVLAFSRLAPAWAIARSLEKLDRAHRKLPAATRARMYGAP